MTISNGLRAMGDLIRELGTVGMDVTQLNAAEGSAGNISVYLRELDGPGKLFRRGVNFGLPVEVPALAGGWVIVTGAGCRLRDAAQTPRSSLCILRIHTDGKQSTLYTETGLHPTSEFNSHLAVHNDQVSRNNLVFHAVLHAQPRYLTYLSHHPSFQDTVNLNRRLLRWEPETVLVFPEGIGVIPFRVPGTPELMGATTELMRTHRAVIWQRHGIVTRSDVSLQKAGDLVEYAEAAAHFEYLNLQLGEPSKGIPFENLRLICEHWKVSASILDCIINV